MSDLLNLYRGKNVLITGGLGFIGSNLARRLVDLGANVTIFDAKLQGYGSNDFNIADIRDRVKVNLGDIRDGEAVTKNVRGQSVVFDLAAQLNHGLSIKEPLLDIAINNSGHINVLQACITSNPRCRIVFPGSRTEYGRVKESDLPVSENHPLNSLDIYSTNKAAMEGYLRTYREQVGLDSVVLRLTNPYGPRAQVKSPAYCIVNWFVAKALRDEVLPIFGDGSQLRDYFFIDDGTEALAIAGVHSSPTSRVYNVGSGKGMPLMEMAKRIVSIAGSGRVQSVPWPADAKNAETGHFVADVLRIEKELGWKAKTDFDDGIRRTIEFYRENLERYF